ncbi:nuclear transport factor 2 family protein [Streptomyces sp. NPDC049555]|uniref:nuclear transport factor 2 family protein n=1 Tax=unclassified Streptomyces TaxID=2593676 RepID=UPI0034267A61
MTSSENLALVRTAYAAHRDRDLDAFLGVFAADAEWVHPDGMADYGLGGTQRGHAGIKEFLARVPQHVGGMVLDPQEFIVSGDRVVVLGVREVTNRRGRTRTLKFLHAWTIRDGKAVRMEDVFDTVAFQRLLQE